MSASLYLIVLILFTITACASKDKTAATTPPSASPITTNMPQTYDLDWKIADGEIIGYWTLLKLTPNSDTATRFDFGDLPDDETGFVDEFEQAIENLSIPSVQETVLVSLLEANTNGNITVKMIVDQLNMPDEDPTTSTFSQLMQGMVGTVQLQGEVTSDGAIASLNLPESQKNLLAIFFELPTIPVQIGDQWKLDIDCISGVSPEKNFKVNQVEFIELAESESGQLVAVLNYTIIEIEQETVESISGEILEAKANCSFLGQGRFLIEEGRWEQFSGEMSIQSSGVITANNTQTFILTPLDEVPPQYLELE